MGNIRCDAHLMGNQIDLRARKAIARVALKAHAMVKTAVAKIEGIIAIDLPRQHFVTRLMESHVVVKL